MDINEAKSFIKSAGYDYFIYGMVIWYGKGRCDRSMECDYIERVGGKVDYEKGFKKIVENIKNENQTTHKQQSSN